MPRHLSALARNDMQKLGRCLRWQEEMLGGRCQGNCQKRPCTRRSAAVFCLSLRGAKRRDNPHPRRGTEQIGCCLGEFVNRCEFASITAYCSVLPQENGLPQVCALARNDMQKLGRCLRWQEEMLGGRCRGNCQKRPCTRRSAAVFCLLLRGTQRLDNPHPCRETEQIGCCLGEIIGGYGFTFSTFCVLYWRW